MKARLQVSTEHKSYESPQGTPYQAQKLGSVNASAGNSDQSFEIDFDAGNHLAIETPRRQPQ